MEATSDDDYRAVQPPYDVIMYQNFHKRLENDQKRLQFQMSGPPDF